jgi:ribosome-associated protein
LQALGEDLAAMSDTALAALDLPEGLRDALVEFRRTRSHEGRRRQLQYIGKLMRQVDAEPLREAVAQSQLGHAHDTLALHEAERWRSALLDDDEALTRWAQDVPGTDLQQLRTLVRNARAQSRREAAPGEAPRQGRAYRELFQFLRTHLR